MAVVGCPVPSINYRAMCLILFSYAQHPRYKLILAANRDEFLERSTAPAGFWEAHPHVLAGRDVKAGGTWMGVTKNLRFAAITNYRDPSAEKKDAPTRGRLVLDFLAGSAAPATYLQTLQKSAGDYNGYNLLVGDERGLWYYSNRENIVREVSPGLYGLSNHLLDTAWPKVTKGKSRLKTAIDADDLKSPTLLDVLCDTQQAADAELPQTGVPLDWERMLSPMFIETPNYGTRASTVLLVEYDGRVSFVERTVHPRNSNDDEVHYTFVGASDMQHHDKEM
ncbi:MAG: NRDE family protein [Bacteroidota bacterium]